MIPIFTKSSTGGYNGSSVTTTLPFNLPGDLMILFVETSNEALSAPSGWTEADDSPATNAGADPTRIHVFYKRSSGGETSVASGDSGDHQGAGVIVIRGAIESGNPFDVTATGTGNGTSVSITGDTTTVNDCLIVGAVASTVDGTNSNNTFSGWTNSNLTNIFEVLDTSGSIGTGGALGVFTGGLATAGTIGTTSVTQGTADDYVTWMGAVKPATTNRPYFVGIGNGASGTAAVTPQLPTQSFLGANNIVFEDDIIVVLVETNNEAVTISGYTEAGSSPASNSNGTRTTVFWKRAGASESDPTTSDSGDHQVARCLVFRNCIDTSDPFDVTNSSTGGSGTSITVPSITTTKDNTLVLAVAGTTEDISSQARFSGWTNGNLSDVTEIEDQETTQGTGGGISAAIGVKASAGNTGTTSVTQATSTDWVAWVGALKYSDDAPVGGGSSNHGYGFFSAL